jgi:hypothetical protein
MGIINTYKILVGKHERKKSSENLRLDMIILKWILNKWL